MTATRLHNGSGGEQSPGVVNRTERFLVNEYDQDAALNSASLQAQIATVELTSGLAVVNRRAVQRAGAAAWFVDVEFGLGNAPERAQPAVDDTQQGYIEVGTSTSEGVLVVPLITGVSVPGIGSGASSQTIYQASEYRVIRPELVITVTGNLESFNLVSDAQAIAGEQSKIHTIGGNDWLFLGGDTFHRSVGDDGEPEHQFTYRWKYVPPMDLTAVWSEFQADNSGDVSYVLPAAEVLTLREFEQYVVSESGDESSGYQPELRIVNPYSQGNASNLPGRPLG